MVGCINTFFTLSPNAINQVKNPAGLLGLTEEVGCRTPYYALLCVPTVSGTLPVLVMSNAGFSALL